MSDQTWILICTVCLILGGVFWHYCGPKTIYDESESNKRLLDLVNVYRANYRKDQERILSLEDQLEYEKKEKPQ